MYKGNESEGHTKLLRKIKINKSNHDKSRIMLTDLCAQEKAKIGELIKTLESRKKQNIELVNQINELRNKFNEQHLQIISLKQDIQKYEIRQRQVERLIQEYKAREKQKQIEFKSALSKLEQHQQKIVLTVDQFSMTQKVILQNQSCQVHPKKKKQRSTEIQTQALEEIKRESFMVRPTNSKSFDKIMKKKQLQEKNSFGSHKKLNKQTSKFKEFKEQECEQNAESEEQFEELAQKWLELKERNLSKIKSNKKRQKTISQEEPRQFSEQQQVYEYNDSFGPQKQELDEPQFDEIQLNKILKSKNFRASRVLNQQSANGQQSEESGKRKSGQRIRNHKQSSASNSRPIDFYQTNLLDLVSSINNPK